MLNKKKRLIAVILTGVVLTIFSLSLKFFVNSGSIILRIAPVICSLGFGLIGGGLGGFCQIKRIEKTPGKSKQMEIEYNDERNEFIRDKANAKAGDISNWFVLLIAYICIIMDYPTWLILLILGVFLLKYILWIILINKYNKEF